MVMDDHVDGRLVILTVKISASMMDGHGDTELERNRNGTQTALENSRHVFR
jgi:hypothetical protein